MKKISGMLSFLLAFALVITTFGSDITSARVFAEGDAATEAVVEAEKQTGEETVSETETVTETETEEKAEDNTEDKEEVLPAIFENLENVENLDENEKVLVEELPKELPEKFSEELPEGLTEELPEEVVPVTEEEIDYTTLDEEAIDKLIEEGKLDEETAKKLVEEGKLSEDILKKFIKEEETAEETRVLSFFGEAYMDGLHIVLNADPKVLPDDAELRIDKVPTEVEEQIADTIDNDLGEEVTVVTTYSYDINIYSPSKGENVQPEQGSVEVLFESIDEAAQEDTTLSVYHVEDDLSYAKEVANEDNTEATAISFDAEHFSIYTIVIKKTVQSVVVPFNVKVVSTEFNGTDYESIGPEQQVIEIVNDVDDYGFIPTESLLKYNSIPSGYSFVAFGTYQNLIECFRYTNKNGGSSGYVQYTIDGTNYFDCNDTTIYAFCRPDPVEFVNYINIGFKEADFNRLYNGGAKVYVNIDGAGEVPVSYSSFDRAAGTYVYRYETGSPIAVNSSVEVTVEYKGKTYVQTYDASALTSAYEDNFIKHMSEQKNFGLDYVIEINDQFVDDATVPVAVFATDGTGSATVNEELRDRLGLNYVQSDGLYPVGVVNLPESLFASAPYINGQGDLDTIYSALKNDLDTVHYLKGVAVSNEGNSVAANVGKIVDTELVDWDKAEYSDTENGSSIELINGANYKYHLNLKFDAASKYVDYYGVYFTDEKQDKVDDHPVYTESFLKGSKVAVTAISNMPDVGSYSVLGLFTDVSCDDKSRIEPGTLTDSDKIYVKYSRKDGSAYYYIEHYMVDGETVQLRESFKEISRIGIAAEYLFDENKYKSENFLYKDTKYFRRIRDYQGAAEFTDEELFGVDRNKILDNKCDDGRYQELVVKIFYRNQEHLDRDVMYFYIHMYDDTKPTGWAQTDEAYYPHNGNHGGNLWPGTATNINDLAKIKDELNDTGKCNYYEEKEAPYPWQKPYLGFYNWTAGIDALSNFSFDEGTRDNITKWIQEEYTHSTDFSEDDVLWYVYKRQNEGPNHIDGYVSTYITYHPYLDSEKFDTNQTPYQGATVRFNTKATILKNQFTREGYVFDGWADKDGNKVDADGNRYDEGRVITKLDSKLHLYATWRRVEDLEGSYQVHYFYQKKDGTFNDGTNGNPYKPEEESGVIPVAFSAPDYADVNVDVTPHQNVRRHFVNYHFVNNYSGNLLQGVVKAAEHSLVLKVYYFRDNEGNKLVVKANSDIKEYNGIALENHGYEIYVNDALVTDGSITASVDGSQLNVGRSNNLVTSVTFGGKTYPVSRDANGENPTIDQNDYDSVTILDGTLEVTPIKLIVKANKDEKFYGDPDPEKFTESVTREVIDAQGNKTYVDFDLNELKNIADYEIKREAGENVLVGDKKFYEIFFDNQVLLNTNYTVEYKPGEFVIKPRPITLRSGDNLDQEFTGEPITNESVRVVRGNFIGEENVYVKMDPEAYAIYPGDVKSNLFDVTGPAPGTLLTNYVIDKEYGILSVKKINGGEKYKLIINVDAGTDGGDRKVEYYNGTVQKLDVNIAVGGNVYTTTEVEEAAPTPVFDFREAIQRFVDGLRDFFVIRAFAAEGENGREITTTITLNGVSFDVGGIYVYGGQGLDKGIYPVWLDTQNMAITVNELPVTDQFDVEFAHATVLNEHGQRRIGELEILPRPVTLTSGSDTKVYDGTPLTKPGVEVTGMGFVQGEVANIRATGSVTDPGPAVKNTIEYDKVGNYKDINYIVTLAEGDLVVTPVGTPETPPETPTDPPTPPTTPTDPPATPTTPTPTPATPINPPAGAVLGATRPLGTGDGAAVLGARRGRTEDTANTLGRIITIIVAAGIGFTMIFIKRKKNEEE